MTGPMTNGSGSLHLSDADARALVDVEVGTPPRSTGASRCREGIARYLFAEGLHPADEALPRRLPLLHVRATPPSWPARIHDGR